MSFDDLTRQEQKIAWMLAQGYTHKQIQEELSIAPTTVKTHAKNIYAKLGLTRQKNPKIRLISLFWKGKE